MNDVRFIRINGRVVPVKGKGSAPKGSKISKRYGAKKERAKPAKQIGVKNGAIMGAAHGASLFGLHSFIKSSIDMKKLNKAKAAGAHVLSSSVVSVLPKASAFVKGAGVGALIGAAIGSVKIYKKKRGESNKQAAKRAGEYK